MKTRALVIFGSLVLCSAILFSGCEEETTEAVANPPAAVTDLHVQTVYDTGLVLAWTVPDGDGMNGTTFSCEFHYGPVSMDDATWETLEESMVRNIHGASGIAVATSIGNLDPDTEYVFAQRTQDDAGIWSGVSNLVELETTCSIDVFAPSSGYSICYGDTLVIKWRVQECHGSSVRVRILLDGEIVTSLGDASGGEFKWACRQIDERVSGYKVRLTDYVSGEIGESSEFSITPECMFNLTHPAGGEYLCQDMPVVLTWDRSTCCGSHVKLMLLHNGQEVETLVESTQAYYSWRWYPQQWQHFVHGYSIKVEDLDSGATAVTDYTFSINLPSEPLLTVPSGGERYYDDQEIAIEWIPDECRNERVALELWQDSVLCAHIASSVPNTGLYMWTVASCSSDSNNYYIRVVDGDLYDTNDQPFTIVRECRLDLLQPAGGGSVCENNPFEIQWDATRWCGDYVNIDLSQHSIVRTSLAVETENDGSFEWVPEQFEDITWGYKIVISDPESGASVNSEPAFTIKDRCAMEMYSPDPGDVLQEGRGDYISWSRPSCCPPGETILLLQHGTICDTLPHIHGHSHSIWWRVAGCSDDPSGYSFRIESNGGQNWCESGIFSISRDCWIDVEPLDAQYCSESVVPIRWNSLSYCGDSVRIELLLDGEVCQLIADSVADDGGFNWTAQQCEANVHGYQVRVTNIESGTSQDSGGFFSIIGSSIYLRADGLGDVPTLKDALEIACHGDTLVLADGIYTGRNNCQIVINDGITVRSASGNPELCSIDGQNTYGWMYLRDGHLQGITITRMVNTAVKVVGDYAQVISNCIFSFNTGDVGGALYCKEGARPKVEYCLFQSNEASRGGAVGSYHGGGAFYNCTFYANNSSVGSAVAATNNTVFNLYNCLLVANTGGDVISFYSDCSVSLECCNSYGHSSNYPESIEEYFGVNGNFSADPRFFNAPGDDYHLLLGSPCLPSGNSCSELIGAYGGY